MAATGASAHEFESYATGLLLASADGPQLFTTEAGHLACNTLLGHGFVTTTKTTLQLVTVLYEGCKVTAHGLKLAPDEPIVATYLFHANGTVTIARNITILVPNLCTITVKAQGPLSSVKYDNIGTTEILLLSHVQGIETSATGAGCEHEYTSSKTGLYRGNAFVKLDGGTIKWV
jgi:hypothetical protein